MIARCPLVRVGLPYSAQNLLADTANSLGAHTLISAGSLWRDGRFRRLGEAAWRTRSALDSAGFTAMMAGGYKWTVSQYVDMVVLNSTQEDDEEEPLPYDRPHPWAWWSAPDFCCEPEIAGNRAEVLRRIDLTVESFEETLGCLRDWQHEGENQTPDPLPVLQGRLPSDYVRCAERIAEVVDRYGCICPSEYCESVFHREHRGLPYLVGVGSVCRRPVHGPEGLLSILSVLDRELPEHVGLHLFGVKGALLERIGPWLHRVVSVDSMAYDLRARKLAHEGGFSCSMQHRAEQMRIWFERQQVRLERVLNPPQLGLFGRAA